MSIDFTETIGARASRPGLFSKNARILRFARFRRRARMLGSQAMAILCLRKGARALALAAWGFIGGFILIASQIEQLGWCAVPTFVLFACLCVAALIDARYFVLPDGPLGLLAAAGVGMRLFQPWPDLASSLAAAAFAFALFRAIAWSFEKLRGYPGLGSGDALLFALAGLWLGWAGLPTCLIVATLSAGLAAAIARRDGLMRHADDPVPFGPHLALGIWFGWTIGPLVAT